jgi:hypothetical protein
MIRSHYYNCLGTYLQFVFISLCTLPAVLTIHHKCELIVAEVRGKGRIEERSMMGKYLRETKGELEQDHDALRTFQTH